MDVWEAQRLTAIDSTLTHVLSTRHMVATSSAQDQDRARFLAEMRVYFLHLFRQGRLGGIFWYVWNEPDHDFIYRGGALMEAGRLAIAPMPAR